jgi:phosphoglycolate phosphatase-like HAD superfamily hydrolase
MSEYLHYLIKSSNVVFWDFDGVIKDSVRVKSIAFEKLFSIYGPKISKKVKVHHEKNPGLSRFNKIPLYMSWSNELVTNKNVQEFCKNFSLMVKKSVIDSPWIPGFLEVIESNHNKQKHILMTSTPQDEIEDILEILDIRHFFYKIYGAPSLKNEAISIELNNLGFQPEQAILIGDSNSDYEAAIDNGIFFFLRRTDLNKDLQKICKDNTFEDFINE